MAPQLLPEDLEADSRRVRTAFRTRSACPAEDEEGAGGVWRDVPVDTGGMARMAVAEGLLPGTRYRFRLAFRPRLSRKYDRGWTKWTAAALSDWFQTDGAAASLSRSLCVGSVSLSCCACVVVGCVGV
jgi:hypothetical protein